MFNFIVGFSDFIGLVVVEIGLFDFMVFLFLYGFFFSYFSKGKWSCLVIKWFLNTFI